MIIIIIIMIINCPNHSLHAQEEEITLSLGQARSCQVMSCHVPDPCPCPCVVGLLCHVIVRPCNGLAAKSVIISALFHSYSYCPSPLHDSTYHRPLFNIFILTSEATVTVTCVLPVMTIPPYAWHAHWDPEEGFASFILTRSKSRSSVCMCTWRYRSPANLGTTALRALQRNVQYKRTSTR